MHMAYDKFAAGSGLFTCQMCGKKTRKTMGDNANEEYCAACIHKMEQENTEADGKALPLDRIR